MYAEGSSLNLNATTGLISVHPPSSTTLESFAGAIIGVCTALAAITLIFTVLRTWSRLLGTGRLAMDDYVAIVNWFLFLFLSVCIAYSKSMKARLAKFYGC